MQKYQPGWEPVGWANMLESESWGGLKNTFAFWPHRPPLKDSAESHIFLSNAPSSPRRLGHHC